MDEQPKPFGLILSQKPAVKKHAVEFQSKQLRPV